MKTTRALLMAGLVVLLSLAAFAQDADHAWSKSFPVSGKPTIRLETSDADVAIHPCEGCHAIRISIELEGRKLGDYRLEANQTGDEVHFRFKELPRKDGHLGWHKEQTRVIVDTPSQLTLEANTSDGNVNISGLEGNVSLISGDGAVDIEHVSGNLRIQSGDGRVRISDASGSIDARTSDASLTVDGLFHAVVLHTSDGTVDLNLHQGTRLSAASTIQTSDGSVTLRVPAGFAADLSVHTSDGRVKCALPVAMQQYQSGDGDGGMLLGKLNGGGAHLTIRTSDGNVKIEQL